MQGPRGPLLPGGQLARRLNVGMSAEMAKTLPKQLLFALPFVQHVGRRLVDQAPGQRQLHQRPLQHVVARLEQRERRLDLRVERVKPALSACAPTQVGCVALATGSPQFLEKATPS